MLRIKEAVIAVVVVMAISITMTVTHTASYVRRIAQQQEEESE